jgi:hypothetical protein
MTDQARVLMTSTRIRRVRMLKYFHDPRGPQDAQTAKRTPSPRSHLNCLGTATEKKL